MGFYELREMNIPSIQWNQYSKVTKLNRDILWTVRTAVHKGNDLNLPRKIGVTADEAEKFANQMSEKLRNKGIIIYYPYFIANKSGTLNIFLDKIIIEAVKEDLWNLVDYHEREVTIFINNERTEKIGNSDFLNDVEIQMILQHVNKIKKVFRDDLIEGKSALLEWSIAQKCNIKKQPIDEEFLVFYEARTV